MITSCYCNKHGTMTGSECWACVCEDARNEIKRVKEEAKKDLNFQINRNNEWVDEVAKLHEEIRKLKNTISFFSSVIKSGESWSETCQEYMDNSK